VLGFVLLLVSVIVLAMAAYVTSGTGWNVFPVLALGAAIPALLQSTRERIEQLKNSIAGNYNTLTTGSQARDATARSVDGKISRTLHVNQSGRRLTGMELGEAHTKWSINGEVHGEFVLGTWAQTEPASSVNKGAFHLQRDPQDPLRFRGQWIGWDPVKCEMGRGDWDWVRSPRAPGLWSRLPLLKELHR